MHDSARSRRGDIAYTMQFYPFRTLQSDNFMSLLYCFLCESAASSEDWNNVCIAVSNMLRLLQEPAVAPAGTSERSVVQAIHSSSGWNDLRKEGCGGQPDCWV